MYRHVEYYPGDPILSLVETFKRDERPEKVNLSIGIYFDGEGKMPVLESVRRAEAERAAVPRPSPYLPMEGLDTYRSAVRVCCLGTDNPALAEGSRCNHTDFGRLRGVESRCRLFASLVP